MSSQRFAWAPWSLVGLRAASAVALALDGLDHKPSWWFLPLFVAAFVSDILDGMIARRLGVSTEPVRKADGLVDTVFYLAVASSAIMVFGPQLSAFVIPLAALLVLQAILQVLSFLKFRKGTSYHGWSAKAWGLALAVGTVGLFGWGFTPILWAPLIMGVVNSLEEISMTLVLPSWRHDVWSLEEARAIALEERKAS